MTLIPSSKAIPVYSDFFQLRTLLSALVALSHALLSTCNVLYNNRNNRALFFLRKKTDLSETSNIGIGCSWMSIFICKMIQVANHNTQEQKLQKIIRLIQVGSFCWFLSSSLWRDIILNEMMMTYLISDDFLYAKLTCKSNQTLDWLLTAYK